MAGSMAGILTTRDGARIGHPRRHLLSLRDEAREIFGLGRGLAVLTTDTGGNLRGPGLHDPAARGLPDRLRGSDRPTRKIGRAFETVTTWHDRAVFHFLTTAEDRARYTRRLLDTLRPGGAAIVATLAPDGPEKCSDLPLQRYSPEQLDGGHQLAPTSAPLLPTSSTVRPSRMW